MHLSTRVFQGKTKVRPNYARVPKSVRVRLRIGSYFRAPIFSLGRCEEGCKKVVTAPPKPLQENSGSELRHWTLSSGANIDALEHASFSGENQVHPNYARARKSVRVRLRIGSYFCAPSLGFGRREEGCKKVVSAPPNRYKKIRAPS